MSANLTKDYINFTHEEAVQLAYGRLVILPKCMPGLTSKQLKPEKLQNDHSCWCNVKLQWKKFNTVKFLPI